MMMMNSDLAFSIRVLVELKAFWLDTLFIVSSQESKFSEMQDFNRLWNTGKHCPGPDNNAASSMWKTYHRFQRQLKSNICLSSDRKKPLNGKKSAKFPKMLTRKARRKLRLPSIPFNTSFWLFHCVMYPAQRSGRKFFTSQAARKSFSRGSPIQTWPIPETAQEKPLAPRVCVIAQWISIVSIKCGTECVDRMGCVWTEMNEGFERGCGRN